MLDCHCHLDRYEDARETAAQSRRRGVFVIAVTNLPSHFKAGLAHVQGVGGVRLAVGLHPLAAQAHEREIGLFRECLASTSFVGEVGLDFSREGKPSAARQLVSFRQIAAWLSGSPKFVSIHSRGAEREVLDILEEHGVRRAVFHWYSGSLKVLECLLAAGHSVSVNPAMLTGARGREIVSRLPRDRILTESDGPYVKVGARDAQPWDVRLVEEHLAEVWGAKPAEVRTQLDCNFKALVELIRPGLV